MTINQPELDCAGKGKSRIFTLEERHFPNNLYSDLYSHWIKKRHSMDQFSE